MKKPRSRLETKLSEEQQMQLADWLLGGMRYSDASSAVQREFGVRVAPSGFQSFWEQVCVPIKLVRRGQGVTMARELAQEAAKRPAFWDEASIDQLKERTLQIIIDPNTKPETVKAYYQLLFKQQDQALQRERLAIDREKLELELRKYRDVVEKVQSELTKAKGGGLTQEGLKKIEEAIGLL